LRLEHVLIASDCAPHQVPGFHRRFLKWDRTQPANRSADRAPEGEAAAALEAAAVSVEVIALIV
jgi:hypothetical protein